MANTIGTPTIRKGVQQFQGLFTDMWTVSATISDQDSISAGDTVTFSLTVPGVALGDLCLVSTTDTLTDGTDQAIMTATVTAADTVGVRVQADVGAFAADALNTTVVRLLILRCDW